MLQKRYLKEETVIPGWNVVKNFKRIINKSLLNRPRVGLYMNQGTQEYHWCFGQSIRRAKSFSVLTAGKNSSPLKFTWECVTASEKDDNTLPHSLEETVRRKISDIISPAV